MISYGQEHYYDNRFPDELFPLSSPSAHSAYNYFWSHTNQSGTNPEAIRETERRLSNVNSILGSFCGDGGKAVYPATYEAAVMCELADIALKDPIDGGRTAARALKEYFKDYSGNTDEATLNYVAGILNDRGKIHRFWEEQTTKFESKNDKQAPDWGNLCELVDLDDMLKFAEDINIESILILAAQLSESLERHLDANDSTDIFDKVRMSESLIAPLLEIMGYDGFAMHLNDLTKQIRLTNLGEAGQKALKAASEALSNYDDSRVSHSVNEVMSRIFGEVDKEAVFESNPNANILMEHGLCQAPDDDQVNYMIIRRKTKGSLAWKAYQDHIKKSKDSPESDLLQISLPMDIIAAQIMFGRNENDPTTSSSKEESTDDHSNEAEIARLATAFSNMLRRATSTESIELKPSPSRKHAAHVRGTEAFRSKIGQAIYSGGYADGFDPKDEQPGGMEVAKLTFQYYDNSGKPPMHFEIQLITERKRIAMRTDKIAHIFFKLGLKDPTDAEIQAMKSIHQRRNSVKEPTVVDPGSAELYIASINAIDNANIGRTATNTLVSR